MAPPLLKNDPDSNLWRVKKGHAYMGPRTKPTTANEIGIMKAGNTECKKIFELPAID